MAIDIWHFIDYKDLIRLFNKKVYEPFVLALMNQSCVIFPGTYTMVAEQSNGECDFVCVENNAKFDAKLPLRQKQVEMLTRGNKHEPQMQEWIKMLYHEVCEFKPSLQKKDPTYNVSRTTLYGIMKDQIEKSCSDENIVFFLPFPITEACEGSVFIQIATDLLDFIYEQLEADNVLNGREIFAIYPASEKNQYVLRNLGRFAQYEFIMNNMVEEYFSHEVRDVNVHSENSAASDDTHMKNDIPMEYQRMPAYLRWRLGVLEPAIESLTNDMADYYEANELRDYHTFDLIIAEAISKAILTMREIIILSSYGLPHGLLSLARRIYEQYIILKYIDLQKGAPDFTPMVENYFLDADVQALRLAKQDNRFHQDPDYQKEILSRESEIESHIQCETKQEYWWCNKRHFSDLQKEIMESASTDKAYQLFLHDLDMMYSISCTFLHANSYSTISRLDAGIDTSKDIDCGPEIEGHSTGLAFAVGSLIGICSVFQHNSKVNISKYIDLFGNLFVFYYEEQEKEARSRTQSPTPKKHKD